MGLLFNMVHIAKKTDEKQHGFLFNMVHIAKKTDVNSKAVD